MRKRGSRPS